MFSRSFRLACLSPMMVLLLMLGCGNGSEGTNPPVDAGIAGSETPESEPPMPDESSPAPAPGIVVQCNVDLGLGPEDAMILDFMDRPQPWQAAWDGDALVLTRRYSCGDECSEEEVLRIEDALTECPQQVGVRVTMRDRGSPNDKVQVIEAREGSLTLQDWQVQRDGPLLVSGRVDAGAEFIFYLDTRED